MKIKLSILAIAFILLIGMDVGHAQLPYGHGICFTVVDDTTDIDIAQDGVVWYSKIDKTLWFTNGTAKYRVPIKSDSINVDFLVVKDSIRIGEPVDNKTPTLELKGDPDSDASQVGSEIFQQKMVTNATASLAYWNFTSSQGAGFKWNKPFAIGPAAEFASNTGFDIANGYYTLKLGADNNATTRTNYTGKAFRIVGYHYTNTETPCDIISGVVGAPTSTQAFIRIGGGDGSLKAFTDINFYTGATNTTTTGNLAMKINNTQFIGIGTDSPLNLVEIRGNKSADTLFHVFNDVMGRDTTLAFLSDGTLSISGKYGISSQQAITLGTSVTTFAVTKNVITVTGDGGGNTIATITGAAVGIYTFIFVDANVTISNNDNHDANSVDLDSTNDFTSADDKVLQLVFDGTSWYKIGSSTN